MNQTKIESIVESCINTSIGFCFGVLTQVIVFPLYDLEVTFTSNMQICVIFTVVSFLRGYAVRRWCNNYLRSFNKAIVTGIRRMLT